jgi:hypothetical protein
LENASSTKEELQIILRELFKVLEETTNEHHVFKDRSYKLNKERSGFLEKIEAQNRLVWFLL